VKTFFFIDMKITISFCTMVCVLGDCIWESE